MNRKKLLTDLYNYCKSNIDDFDLREQLAWSIMDRCRCSFQSASDLYDEMTEKIDEFCQDYNIVNDFDTDDVFMRFE